MYCGGKPESSLILQGTTSACNGTFCYNYVVTGYGCKKMFYTVGSACNGTFCYNYVVTGYGCKKMFYTVGINICTFSITYSQPKFDATIVFIYVLIS